VSRCVLDDEARSTEVVIGWDPGAQSFFAQVWDRELGRAQRRAGVASDDAGLLLWTGGFDRIWTTPDELIELIQPYACTHDRERLRRELLTDQANDDGCRNYDLCEDEPPESDVPAGWQPPEVR